MDNKPEVLIVDGDILAFTIGRLTEDITDFGDQICKSFDKDAIVEALEAGLDRIGLKCGYERKDIIFAISCTKNFRKQHFPTYKSNRKDVVKPLGLKWLREYLIDNSKKYNLLMIENLEADDALGIFGTSGDKGVSIHSEDKDLKTIPVRQWCFKTNKFVTPTPLESMRFLYTQVLTGDTVDGYKGCPRIGKVKARAALIDCTNELEMLEQCYVRYATVYGCTPDAETELLKQIGQARILHSIDYTALVNFNETYNPFKVLNVSETTIISWYDKYVDELKEAKAAKKHKTLVAAKVKRQELKDAV